MSTNPQAPGVYVNFMTSGTQPIEGVATAITAFIGFTEKAEMTAEDGRSTVSARNKAILVTSWDQYVKHFGGFIECAYTPHAVKGYFDNGGKIAYVISILSDTMLGNDDVKQSMKLHQAQLLLQASDPSNPVPTLLVKAKKQGCEGNSIAVAIEHVSKSRDKFNLIVWTASPKGTVELSNLTMDVNDKEHFIEKVNSDTDLKEIIEVVVFERTGDPSKRRPKASTEPEFLKGGEVFASQLKSHKEFLANHPKLFPLDVKEGDQPSKEVTPERVKGNPESLAPTGTDSTEKK